MTAQCRCGRFLADARPIVGIHGEGYSRGPYVTDVVGTCKRHGADSPALRGLWHSWDAWEWPEGWE